MSAQQIMFGAGMFLVAGYFIYRLIRYSGFRGAIFGAEIRRTVGEVEGVDMGKIRRVLRVHVLGPEGSHEKKVGLELTSRSFASYEMAPISLSRTEVVKLITLLQQTL